MSADTFAAPAPAVSPSTTPPAAMSDRTRHALGVAAGALLLGALGDGLLRPTPWGLNLALWTLALVAVTAALQRWTAGDAELEWAPVALGVAVLMAWRDSPTLKGLDLAALLVTLGLAVYRARGGAVLRAGLAAHAVGLVEAAWETVSGPARLVGRDVRWAELPRGRWSRAAAGVARGLTVAVPLLLLFGALLASADAAFERLLGRLFSGDGDFASHLMLAALFTWVAGGILRPLVLPPEAPPTDRKLPRKPSVGIVETATVLGLLNVLFLAFVAVQVPYFFGSAAMVEAPGTTTYAQYARRGFFELVWVAGMVLPMLLVAEWLLRKESARVERTFRLLAGAMVALLLVIVASALHRMRLYQAAYGLTELRLYTTAFMGWLAVLFAWFAATVLLGRRERFAFGGLMAALLALVLLHGVNPDGL
ncbi:MAG TPA: DUF4173 domain-containing protein, partial [Longimicrobium sp.]|nr:DUF4173 domain-containing protein [Longimicrobium sp.]